MNTHNSAGGSRAAKKRKKKSLDAAEAKALREAADEQEVAPTENNDVHNVSTSNNKKHKSLSNTGMAPELEHLEVDVNGRSILDVIALEEPMLVTSAEKAALVLACILGPNVPFATFFKEYWCKKPLHAPRQSKTHLKGLISKKALLRILQNQALQLGKDLEIFTQCRGETNVLYPLHKNTGETNNEVVKSEALKQHQEGAILRFLSPQKHIDTLWHMLVNLETEFNSRVGCHAEIIPSSSTGGFGKILVDKADSFIIQVAGCSSWRIFSPKKNEELKHLSSFIACESTNKEQYAEWSALADSFVASALEEHAYIEVVLDAGDTLYIPRGWGFAYGYNKTKEIDDKDDAEAGEDRGKKKEDLSLHLRLYTNTDNTVKDLLELTLPAALQVCYEENSDFRKSLPVSYSSTLGAVHCEKDDDINRQSLLSMVANLVSKVSTVASSLLDSSGDQLVKTFISQRLPIPLTSYEESRSASGFADARIMPYTRLRMLRPGIARCLVEDNVCVLYHCMDNSRELFGASLNPLEFDLDDGVCIDALLAAYPQAVMVADLPHPSEEDEDKLGVAQALYKEGFLVIDDDAVTGGEHDDEMSEEESVDDDDAGANADNSGDPF